MARRSGILVVYPKIGDMITTIRAWCKLNNVQFELVDEPYCSFNGQKVSGYFTGRPAKLAVAIGRPHHEWVPVLLHEFNHGRQWKENAECWRNNNFNGVEGHSLIDLWVNNKIELNYEQLESVFAAVMAVEYDCEVRTIEMINSRYSSVINPIEYTKKANAYVRSYECVKFYRRWPNTAPYADVNIYDTMPDKMLELSVPLKKRQLSKLKRVFL